MTIRDSGMRAAAPRRFRRDHSESVCRFIESLVATALGIGLAELRAGSRGRAAAALARQTAMYLAHVHFGISLSQVGRTFGRDRTTIAHACSTIEDARDSREFDAEVAVLETIIAAAAEFAASLYGDTIDGDR